MNKKPSKSWTKGLEKFDLEKSIGWNLAIVKKIDKFFVEIETNQNDKGKIEYQDISRTKKEIVDILKIGDVIYVKKLKNNFYSLKQIPEANGGIVAIDPFTGRVLAMSGGFSFKKSEQKFKNQETTRQKGEF